ncbi:hypothetical protein DH2020_031697 [Rehmannia glutinosa]|uniref:F-box domain-containing protein n=1 Tax=Rehmannia glutinosa TaxID=99300 RepID=A0ABR0VKN5_REHGL
MQIVTSIDRLSGLPDDILCHILSFLPTKLSVATSILAKRWRYMWPYVPNVHFDHIYHNTNIINRIMFLHKVQNLTTFRLYYKDNNISDEHEVDTWITTVISHHIKNLDINLGNNHIKFHEGLFTSKILVDLRLDCCLLFPLNGVVCLPRLKKLHLSYIKLDGDETLPHLISGCPVLEELIIKNIVNQKMVSFSISSSTIKRLKVAFDLTLNKLMLSSYFDNTGKFEREAYMVKIDTPALSYLHVYSRTRYEYVSVGSLTSLIEADVDLEFVSPPIEMDDLLSRSTLEFVGRLCNVKCLKLSIGWMEVPDSEFSALNVKFHNLTKLEIAPDWRFISKFLENADNLEVLMIRTVEECLKYWVDPEQVPTCLLSHLETVRINKFEGREQEFNIVRYLLKNVKVLKRMEIYSPNHSFDFKAKFDALQKISLFQRGCEACEVAFY